MSLFATNVVEEINRSIKKYSKTILYCPIFPYCWRFVSDWLHNIDLYETGRLVTRHFIHYDYAFLR